MNTYRMAGVALLLIAGCDYKGEDFYGDVIEHVPGVLHLGNDMVVQPVDSENEVQSAPMFAEIGNMGSVARGGATISFRGTGRDVCVWVDPETLYWNQSVSATSPTQQYTYPDNVYDDGDIDLFGGLSVYYNGSPGETVGNFEVKYEDKLGNPVPVEFNECTIYDYFSDPTGHGGRGAPEYCTLKNTIEDVPYTILLDQFLVPLDDNRMGFGLILGDGSCDDMKRNANVLHDECLIVGESLKPADMDGHDYRENPIRAQGQQQASELAWTNSIAFEQTYCDVAVNQGLELVDFCKEEASNNDCDSGDVRCFCGDLDDTPTAGSF
jgi:hypothetical protein